MLAFEEVLNFRAPHDPHRTRSSGYEQTLSVLGKLSVANRLRALLKAQNF